MEGLPANERITVDSAPIIYILEDHPKHATRFRPLFERHAAGELRFAVTTITMAEVLAGPLGVGEEALAKRYRTILDSWEVVELSADIAERRNLYADHPEIVQRLTALMDKYVVNGRSTFGTHRNGTARRFAS